MLMGKYFYAGGRVYLCWSDSVSMFGGRVFLYLFESASMLVGECFYVGGREFLCWLDTVSLWVG